MAAPTASAEPAAEVLLLAEDACREGDAAAEWPRALGALSGVSGPFAAAWHDSAGHLHLARDPLGHRSLYWGRDRRGRVRFGTRLHDVLRAGVPRELDPVALATYLATAYVPGERTLAAGVFAVPPGVELVFETPTADPVRRRFWDLPASPERWAEEAHLRGELRALLERTVAAMLPEPGAKVAATLSGGIDSSLVVALARRRVPVDCLSIAFGAGHADELAWSGMVARHCGATHDVVTVRPEDVARRFDATVGALSEPNGDPLTVPNAMLFARAKALGHAVVLNGEGGDPCFGGPKNAPLLLAEVYGDASAPYAREQAYLRAHLKLWDELDRVLCPAWRERVPVGALEALVTPYLKDERWPSFLDRLMALNVAWKGAGHILPKVEHLGLAAGVRPRSPLFDRDVAAFAFAIPPELKRKGSVEKHLLKEAVRDLLPAAILERPKSGMLVPVEAWFTGPLQAFARERLLDGLRPRMIVHREYLERLVDPSRPSLASLGGLRPRRGVKIWLLLTLEAWLRCVLEGA